MIEEKAAFDIDIEQRVVVQAPINDVFEGLIHRMGEGNKGAEDAPMPMVLERRPGGRWYRDLGNDAGHLWGHVQAIRPPDLLEVYGPLAMSLPVANNVIIRLKEIDDGTEVVLKHIGSGPVPEGWDEGYRGGWGDWLNDVKTDCEA
jgi:hypothetical protein